MNKLLHLRCSEEKGYKSSPSQGSISLFWGGGGGGGGWNLERLGAPVNQLHCLLIEYIHKQPN